MEKVERRKIKLIQKDVQIGFLKLIFVLYFFVISSVSIFWLGVFFLVGRQSGLVMETVKEVISRNSGYISLLLLVQIVTTFLIIYYLFIRFSHKVCGPIFSLERTLKQINSEKEIRSFRVRKDDFYQDFAKHLNIFVKNHSEYKSESVPENK